MLALFRSDPGLIYELGNQPALAIEHFSFRAGYPRETVIAEKYQALVTLGMANSRMKDFYDLWVMARDSDFQGESLA